MQNPNIGPITDEKQPSQSLKTHQFADMPLGILETLKRPSNQMLRKNSDDSLEGLRYIVSTEPSSLRPVRAWTILIERWECKTMADITAQDVLFLRINNGLNGTDHDYADIVRDIYVNGNIVSVTNYAAFNAVMAAGVLINKIDSGQLPDIQKILDIYNIN